ncbi:MAG: DUF1236 domain-containing protein [Pseudorhodoplanes sp.]|uniref:DUF1236 domain-containing protein n=1 Tax=Pseudorhodoplanes sp. TaxID=1934341 RepID=UPI003D11D4A3
MTRVIVSAIVSLAFIATAHAQTTGTATTDLNIRSGPGPEQPVIGLIKAKQQARILGCIEGSLWCQVDFRGQIGWSYSQYMSLAAGGGTIVVREPAHVASVPVITYNPPGAVAVVPTYRPEYIPPPLFPTPTVIGPGGAGAAAIGAPDPITNLAPVTPPPTVGAYVTSNVAPSVVYPGAVVVGASIPHTVVLNNVPDYRYQYVYVNDTPVLVDPVTRRIVYVFR